MKVAIIGSGKVGGALGVGWARKGHEVIFGVRKSRDDEFNRLLARAGANAKAASVEVAARFADVIVLTVPWAAVEEVIKTLGELQGKVLLDCTNPVSEWPAVDHGQKKSGGELVAGWAVGSRVIKIFNTTGYENMANPKYAEGNLTMLYAGDDLDAKKIAHQLAADLGFEPQDAGPLANARSLEVLASLWGALAYGQKLGRSIGFRLLHR
jgi:8-hydroxy-5-deazaflavin:NADPH oxidoreductase